MCVGSLYLWIIFSLFSSSKPTGFTSSVIFDGIEEALKNDGKALVNKVKGIFAFKVKKPDGKEGQISLYHLLFLLVNW